MPNNFSEQAAVCTLDGHELHGIFSVPDVPTRTAVLIVVGGPQYRVGSHRQFVLLARHLASQGILALRFDYGGMGFSEGFPKQFYEIDADISIALDLIQQQHRNIEHICVWGLCDAAAAIAFYAHTDDRIKGVVLLNPWVRSETSHSKALLSNYYQDRFFDVEVWKDLLKSPSKIFKAVISLCGVVFTLIKSLFARGEYRVGKEILVEERIDNIAGAVFKGLTNYRGNICLILSGSDLTAQEFEQELKSNEWLNVENNRTKTQIHRIDDANHTFSSTNWRAQVERITLDFVA